MSNPLADLNEAQRQVVTAIHGPVLVLAGAGSGKTRALTHRLAYLVASKVVQPHELLAVTFTNKAAQEMRERVARLIGPAVSRAITCGTFHSLGARILREQYHHTNRSQSFTILDTGDSERLIKQIMDHQQISSKQWSVRSIRHAISRAKNALLSPADLTNTVNSAFAEITAKVFQDYQAELKRHDSYDFDDLIGELLALLKTHDSTRRHYQQRWRYISIDEYQDTNPPQEAVIEQLVSPQRNICVVGDDYQAIYSWRGAQVDHILRFEKKYPGCTTIYLTQNYRSTPAILTAANAIIAENAGQKHKRLWTDRLAGTPVSLIAIESDWEEARVVARAIVRNRDKGGRAGDCAILYRTNAQSRLFEEALVGVNVPYTIVGALRFYDRAEVKDALAFAIFLVNPRNAVALQRMVAACVRGVGVKTVNCFKLEAQNTGRSLLSIMSDAALVTARQRNALAPLIRAYGSARQSSQSAVREQLTVLLETSGYLKGLRALPDGQERLENVEELLNVAGGFREVMSFVEAVALVSDIDTASPENDHVLCLTLHAAKGLEFKYVWLAGCEEGLLPHKNSVGSLAELEEERRLLYVGMTRAQEHLTLSYANCRTIHGQNLPQLPSRFLDALPAAEVERIDLSDFERKHPAANQDVIYSEYEVGDVVPHHVFGQGIVIQTQGNIITAVFEGFGVKTFSAEIAPNNQ